MEPPVELGQEGNISAVCYLQSKTSFLLWLSRLLPPNPIDYFYDSDDPHRKF